MWSWILEGIGLTGAIFAGKKKWWAWAILLANAVLWVIYGILSHQYGFVVASGFYGVVYTRNLIQWKLHPQSPESPLEAPLTASNPVQVP